VIDPYNDFISEGGKIWGRIRTIAEANGCVPHMLQVLNAARKAKLRVVYAMHHRYRPGDYETWKVVAPIQKAAWRSKAFEYGTWGGEIRAGFEPMPGEIVATEHWCSSGFANTDLDLQLKKHGIQKLIVIGLIAHTCVEATRPLCGRTRLRRHGGKRCDGGLLEVCVVMGVSSPLMSAVACRPAPARCSRHTSLASSHRAGRSASRAHRAA
jgi:Isochorismatase family